MFHSVIPRVLRNILLSQELECLLDTCSEGTGSMGLYLMWPWAALVTLLCPPPVCIFWLCNRIAFPQFATMV